MSAKEKTLNMTEGSCVKLLLVFALPMLVGNIFQQIYNLVDSVIVGRLIGADALAAIGATSSVTFLFFALCNGIGSGGGIIASQFFGNNDTQGVKKTIANTGYVMLVFPTIVGIAAFMLSKPLLTALDTPANIIGDADIYIKVMCVGIVFVSVYNFVSSMLRALGDSKTPLYFLVFSCALNGVLDYLFVAIFHKGVFGAAVATVISQFISGAGCVIYAVKCNSYFKLSREDFKIDLNIIGRTMKLGIPLSLQFSLIAISCMALQRVVNSFGEVAVAAFTATSRIEQLIHQPYGTLSAALATYTGQNFGAKKLNRVKEGFVKSMIMMTVFTLVMWPLMSFCGRWVVSLFVTEEAVIVMGAKSLIITSIFYFSLGTINIIRGVQNGLGDGFFAMFNGIVEVILRFTVPIFLTSLPIFGVWGIWWAVGIVWFISAVTCYVRYEYYRRRKVQF